MKISAEISIPTSRFSMSFLKNPVFVCRYVFYVLQKVPEKRGQNCPWPLCTEFTFNFPCFSYADNADFSDSDSEWWEDRDGWSDR
jgi:hypothetical protein